MTLASHDTTTVPAEALDGATRMLVRTAAVIAVGDEPAIRAALTTACRSCDAVHVEEVVLQSYLFAGFPRALNAAREWRRISGRAAPADDEGAHFELVPEWARRGAETCAIVYGPFYDGLRKNIRDLHPALDAWMIVDGYGRTLARPGLDLRRRELCVVGVCSAARQDRQLHSHLHGALHAGATAGEVAGALAAVADLLSPDDAMRHRFLFARVIGK